MARAGVDPAEIEDVILGCALQQGSTGSKTGSAGGSRTALGVGRLLAGADGRSAAPRRAPPPRGPPRPRGPPLRPRPRGPELRPRPRPAFQRLTACIRLGEPFEQAGMPVGMPAEAHQTHGHQHHHR